MNLRPTMFFLAMIAAVAADNGLAADPAPQATTSSYKQVVSTVTARRYARLAPRRELMAARGAQNAVDRRLRILSKPQTLPVPAIVALNNGPRWVTFGSYSYAPYRYGYWYDRYPVVYSRPTVVTTPAYYAVNY